MKSMNQTYTSFLTVVAIFFTFLFMPNGEPDLTGKSTTVIGVSPDSLKKDHLIFVFIPTCGKCRKAAVQVEKLFERDSNVTGLTAEDFQGDIKELRDSFNITFPILTTDKPRLKTYFRHIPRFVYVHDSLITAVLDSLKVE